MGLPSRTEDPVTDAHSDAFFTLYVLLLVIPHQCIIVHYVSIRNNNKVGSRDKIQNAIMISQKSQPLRFSLGSTLLENATSSVYCSV